MRYVDGATYAGRRATPLRVHVICAWSIEFGCGVGERSYNAAAPDHSSPTIYSPRLRKDRGAGSWARD
jgi:hypothetical protein